MTSPETDRAPEASDDQLTELSAMTAIWLLKHRRLEEPYIDHGSGQLHEAAYHLEIPGDNIRALLSNEAQRLQLGDSLGIHFVPHNPEWDDEGRARHGLDGLLQFRITKNSSWRPVVADWISFRVAMRGPQTWERHRNREVFFAPDEPTAAAGESQPTAGNALISEQEFLDLLAVVDQLDVLAA